MALIIYRRAMDVNGVTFAQVLGLAIKLEEGLYHL